jgi:cytochrome c oxidase subunit 4
MSGHKVVSWRVYLAVFLALCALTVTTVVVAGHDFGPLNLIVALGVAITKASLVVLYFMHARYSPKLTGLVIASSLAFFAILVFLTLTDYLSRSWALTAGG